jgi:hypothetical protein
MGRPPPGVESQVSCPVATCVITRCRIVTTLARPGAWNAFVQEAASGGSNRADIGWGWFPISTPLLVS